MQLFQILQTLDPEITPDNCKVHLAGWNGAENPLDVYHAGGFDDWQAWQTQRNFKRDYVISLISLPEPNRWLLAGAYDAHGCEPVKDGAAAYRYRLERRDAIDDLSGRLVVEFERDGRNAYRNAESCAASLYVAEILRERHQVVDFPGFTKAMLTHQQLETIVRQRNTTWETALTSPPRVPNAVWCLLTPITQSKQAIGTDSGDAAVIYARHKPAEKICRR